MQLPRNPSRLVQIGSVTIGGGRPHAVQSMTATPTQDVEATVSLVNQLAEAGADLVRIAVDSKKDAAALAEIRRQMEELREAGMSDVPVVFGGIIPQEDVNILKQCGASAVYTPKDFQLNEIMTGIVGLVNDNVDALAKAG